MNCDTYLKMTPVEKRVFANTLLHIVQNDETACIVALEMIASARRRGKIANLIIDPVLDKISLMDITNPIEN